MAKCAREDGTGLVVLSVCLCSVLLISSGCKKKERSEGIEQGVPAGGVTHTSISERVSWPEASEKIDLRILYAGLLETDRAKDFAAFLAAHFEEVETTDYTTFKEAESTGSDVTILDHDGVDHDPAKAVYKLSHQYTHAAVAVGVPGALICEQLSLKTAYL